MSTTSVTSEAATPLAARANGYNLLARCLSLPRAWDAGLAEQLRTGLSELGPALAGSAELVATALESARADRESVDLAYARLFLGPATIDASPYESAYLEPDGRIMGDVSLLVARAYAEAGLEPAPGPREAPDHVTHELEFLYYLAFEELSTTDPVWAARREAFWNEHAGLWLPRFAEAIRAARRHEFYDAFGELLERFVHEEALLYG